MSIATTGYTAAAGFGRVYSFISAILCTLIVIYMIICGISIIVHKRHLQSVGGKITKASHDCTTLQSTDTTGTTLTCKFNVSYVVDKKYSATFSSVDVLARGDNVTVWYDPNHPDQAEFNPISKTVGWMLIAVAVFLLVAVWASVWFTQHSKVAAAASGAIGMVEMISQIY